MIASGTGQDVRQVAQAGLKKGREIRRRILRGG